MIKKRNTASQESSLGGMAKRQKAVSTKSFPHSTYLTLSMMLVVLLDIWEKRGLC
jgi:hypothetical protein